MIARNDITGDALITKESNDAYRDGWERIFGKKDKKPEPPVLTDEVKPEELKPNEDVTG